MSVAVKLPDLTKGIPSLTNMLRNQRSESKDTAFIMDPSAAALSRVKLTTSTDFGKLISIRDPSPSPKTKKVPKNGLSQILIDTSVIEIPFS